MIKSKSDQTAAILLLLFLFERPPLGNHPLLVPPFPTILPTSFSQCLHLITKEVAKRVKRCPVNKDVQVVYTFSPAVQVPRELYRNRWQRRDKYES